MTAPQAPQCSRGWGARCPRSTGPRCTCACGGRNHGNPAARPDNAEGEALPATPPRTLSYAWNERPAIPTRAALLAPDAREVRFIRTVLPGPWGDVTTARVYLVDGETQTQLPRRYVKHSPTGFEWGYGGSGPADTALNILALVVPIKEASRFYQDFKFDCIARIPQDEGGTISLAEVRHWLADQYAKSGAHEAPAGEGRA